MVEGWEILKDCAVAMYPMYPTNIHEAKKGEGNDTIGVIIWNKRNDQFYEIEAVEGYEGDSCLEYKPLITPEIYKAMQVFGLLTQEEYDKKWKDWQEVQKKKHGLEDEEKDKKEYERLKKKYEVSK